jgi:glycosyltransferase involved in cell wall biosynthesis
MRLVFVGRVEYQKGLHLLCRAMNRISIKAVRLDVFGNIVDEEYFEKCRKQFLFDFRGTVPREELLSKLTDYDFLILPSEFTEMYPLVIQEAFAAQLPVIASAAKGNIALIKEGKNGFIFNYANYKHLASVIDEAYSLKKDGWQPEFETTDSH